MLSQERFDFVKGLVDNGTFIRRAGRIWKGNVSFACHEDDVNYGKGDRKINASKYRVQFSRDLKTPEFKKASFLAKAVNRFFRDHVYATRYGMYVNGCNLEKVLSKVESFSNDIKDISRKVVANRALIIDSMKKQYAEVAHDIWQRRYGDRGKPPANFVDMMVRRYVENFPDEESIPARFSLEVYPVGPLITQDMEMAKFVDYEHHNMKVYRALYDEIVFRRRGLYNLCNEISEQLSSKPDSGKYLAGIYKRALVKIRGYLTLVYYDERLMGLVDEICNSIAVSEGRDRDSIVAMLMEVTKIIETDKMLVFYV